MAQKLFIGGGRSLKVEPGKEAMRPVFAVSTPRLAELALGQTTGFSVEEQGVLIELLRRSAAGGPARGCLQAAALARFGVRDFDWPDFDRWQEFFAQRRQFPPLWERLEEAPAVRATADIHRAYGEHKLYLLIDWLQGLDTTRDEVHAARARYAKLGVGARITRQGAGTPCPACDPLDHREVTGTPAELPPFHPGCRCLLLSGRRS